MELGISGLASGFDWRSFVDQMIEVERSPQRLLRDEQNQIEQRRIAYTSIKTQLAVLQNRLKSLTEAATFDARLGAISDSTMGSVTAGAGTPLGTFEFNFSQLATAAKLNGLADIGASISASNDVSGVVLGSAGFSTAITAGTFTVNGAQVTVSTSESLQDVFSAIETATGGAVTASYDSATDRITLSSSGAIVLGSATDSSNFLRAAKLYNNGSGEVTSSDSLGGIRRAATLVSGNFATAIDDGGGGVFKINGVEISFSATADSLNNVIDRINNSNAGVLASYDQVNDRVVLTNKSTGDVGIHIEDVSGNFAAATGLAGGALERGKNLLYTVNGGGTLISETNTVSEASSGIAGLSVTALSQGSATVTVSTDTSKIKAAIEGFVAEYNKTQSIIDTQTASSTDSKGKVTAGLLAGENDASSLAAKLRSIAYQALSSFSTEMDQLADLGITTNGTDNNLEITDPDALDAALANNLAGVKKLFADGTSGIAVLLDEFVESAVGEDGSLDSKNETLAKQIASIDTQMSDLERVVQSNRQRLIDSFIAMETAQAQINQQLQFLMQRFGGSSGAQ
jgi:flagellar hook-associated protein 2